MNSLISINVKFMGVSPKELVELILKSKYTKGVEIYIDISKYKEVEYLDNLVFELKKNNLFLQIHGESNIDVENQIKFIKKVEGYSDYLGYPIVFTLHSIYDSDKSLSVKKTIDYLYSIIDGIDNSKINICLENLNDVKGMDRLEKEIITPIIINNERLYFTYDIGHELMDHGELLVTNKYLMDNMKNIHIHTNNIISDHQPIYRNDNNFENILKAITFLKLSHYKYNVVFEYDLYACSGDTTIEKIKNYLDSIDIVSEYL